MKRLKEIWSKRQLPRLLKELEWRDSEFKKIEKQLRRMAKERKALEKHIDETSDN